MRNFKKGWITTALGLFIMIADAVHFFGIYQFPHPSMLDKTDTVAIAFIVGLFLFLVPATKLEEWLEKKAGTYIDKPKV